MILHLRENLEPESIEAIASDLQATVVQNDPYPVLICSDDNTPEEKYDKDIQDVYEFDSDVQLSSRDYRSETRTIEMDSFEIGGESTNTLMMAGPCSVESREQLNELIPYLKETGLKVLRGGCFKPRTSPYSFQGLGIEGLEILDDVREKHGFKIITEVRDATHVEEVIRHTDIVQIGSKSMYNHGVLRACGETNKPILLKRGFGSTLEEFAKASEFILSSGNPNVILCERGIRTLENKTRFTLDLCGVAWIKKHLNLPVVVDPSHAMGYRYGVPDLTKAAFAMGVEGLLIEVHPNPEQALSDAQQQLTPERFQSLHKTLEELSSATERDLI